MNLLLGSPCMKKQMNRGIQPPLVDTTACLCRVDTALVSVTGAKKYVPGTKLFLRPDIKPSFYPSRHKKPPCGERIRNQSPFLPGLPDDLAIACLIRVPRVDHHKLRLVCKRWYRLLADMSTSMVPYIGVVYDGKWFLKGLGSHGQVISEAYNPEIDNWVSVSDGMVAGWRNPSVAMTGKLYALDCKDGCKIKFYDEASDSWSEHVDSKMHLGNSKASEAAALVPLNGKLRIIRNNMTITLVDVLKSDLGGAITEHLWETIAGKRQLKTLVTNLLSNLAGRTRLKSHIVHCQVLQA